MRPSPMCGRTKTAAGGFVQSIRAILLAIVLIAAALGGCMLLDHML